MGPIGPMITDLASLKKFFQENVHAPIFGVSVYAFDRLGLEDVVPNYRLLALRYSKDTKLIEKDIEVFSLEKGMGLKHINAPRNSTTVIGHPKTKEYLDKFTAPAQFAGQVGRGSPRPQSGRPALIVYKSSSKMEKECRKNGWTLVAPPVKFGKSLFEDKIKFRKILEEIGVSPTPGEVVNARDLNFYKLKTKYGLPFVLQHPRRGGGKGTFFISHEDDWHKAIKRLKVKEVEGEEVRQLAEEDISDLEVIVAKYIKGPSPSITGCVTRHGVLSTSPQYQLIDVPELYNPQKGSGLFCGHDWSSSRFPESVEKQIYKATRMVGKYFQTKGYKGIFGLDFVLNDPPAGGRQKVYVTEANPRLLGSFPVITMAQIRNNETPMLAFHILEYLDIDYKINRKEINKLMRKPKIGAQMFPHNLTDHWARSNARVRAGVYRLKNPKSTPSSDGVPGRMTGQIQNAKLEFVRPGYAMKHLKNKDEFLLTDGVLQKKAHYSPNRRLGRIITLRRVLRKDKKNLTPWARQVPLKVHSSFKLKRVWFVKLRKFFNPEFLAKG